MNQIIIDLTVLWDPMPIWTRFVQHLDQRFARSTPLPAMAAGSSIADQYATLSAWNDDLDLDREIGRYFDEHVPLYARPDRQQNQQLRGLATRYEIYLASEMGETATRSATRHLGIDRSITAVIEPTGVTASELIARAEHVVCPESGTLHASLVAAGSAAPTHFADLPSLCSFLD